MVANLTGQMNDTKISISGNQMFLVFKTNHEIVSKGFHALIMESKFFQENKLSEIIYFLSQYIHFYFIDDHCQYWLNKGAGTLTSPNFGVNDDGSYQYYDHNLNCTWILNTDQGYYITLEIEDFWVNNNHETNDIYLNFSNKIHHSSFRRVTIAQYTMDQISNHHKYQNCIRKVSIQINII